ncbi:nuclear transport factor 2 family protein [Agrobacterium rhizogenes]|nr:nuclear transport factor 2 family protein [Rhizobium rhizogenes]NTH62096.1 nuclear transport factor 2 family protein [Rhizobium rhizogenes]NTH93722.1 nuclear transport factor 2 family protein [Rhizobium rhizogenes]
MCPLDCLMLYETRVNRRRFDEIVPLISAEAIFWFPEGTHRGIDAIGAAFEEAWRHNHNEFYWLEDIDWVAMSDTTASCIYRFRWKAVISGIRHEGSGRGTTVFRKEGTQWKIIHEHLSRCPSSKFRLTPNNPVSRQQRRRDPRYGST